MRSNLLKISVLVLNKYGAPQIWSLRNGLTVTCVMGRTAHALVTARLERCGVWHDTAFSAVRSRATAGVVPLIRNKHHRRSSSTFKLPNTFGSDVHFSVPTYSSFGTYIRNP